MKEEGAAIKKENSFFYQSEKPHVNMNLFKVQKGGSMAMLQVRKSVTGQVILISI